MNVQVVLLSVWLVALAARVSGQDCTHGDVRLVQTSGTPKAHQGRVDVCINGAWGTVVDDGWDSLDARVVCRQLGYSDVATRPYTNGALGQGTGLPILMDNVGCIGNEAWLIDCPFTTPVGDFHSEDAGVGCYTQQEINSTTCSSGQIRLVSGPSPNEGRLEVCMGGTWGTVVDDGFQTVEAKVVCRQLGYADGYGLRLPFGYFPYGTGSIFMDNLGCTGSEASLFDCKYVFPRGDTHNEDIGVRCFNTTTYPNCNLGELRLVGGSNEREGRIEICLSGQWGTICDDAWSSYDARVACRQLGFAAIGSVAYGGSYTNSNFGSGAGKPIWIDNAYCNAKELKLMDCNIDGNTNEDNHNEDAGLRCPVANCDEGMVRLAGGPSTSAGRVELCYGGNWATVCDKLWGQPEASVVCRQLGYTSDAVFAYSNAYYGSNTALPIRMDDTRCTGTEDTLLHCTYDINVSGCSHSDDASVQCTAGTDCTHGSVRLVGGATTSQGRLEVCLYGIWGTVNSANFGIVDATVVCRQLQFYPNYGTAIIPNTFGTSTGVVHMTNLRCNGSEQNLVDCMYSRDTDSGNHAGDVGIQCLETGDCSTGDIRLVSGNSPRSGRVEVCMGGVWGTVNDEQWGTDDAKVVCRQLDYVDGYGLPYDSSYFGNGVGPISMSRVQCTGSEERLINCTYSPSDADDAHNQDAGVKCVNQTDYLICNVGDVRLVGGNTGLEGRAEICIDGMWGSICDVMWSQNAANVLCGQLGFASYGASSTSGGTLGQGYGSIWLTEITCSPDTPTLLDCQFSANTASCTHSDDAGARCLPAECDEGMVRLVNGSNVQEGRVEVCKNRRWGTVCDGDWGVNDAKVVCRQLGYSTTDTVAFKQSAFGSGTSPIRLSNVRCSGSENSFLSCPYSTDTAQCSGVAAVSCATGNVCNSGDVRLFGGESSYTGRVLVCIGGHWGTVTNENWGTSDARVVCRQLGFLDTVGVPITVPSADSLTTPILMDEVGCNGDESRLVDCRFSSDTEDHTHNQDAGVTCFPNQACSQGEVRLVGGQTDKRGRVELCIGGEWGTVANNGWNSRAAQVVCKQIFGDLVTDVISLSDTTNLGISLDPVVLHSVSCNGNEGSLLDCTFDTDTRADTHTTDVGVECIVKARPVPPQSTSIITSTLVVRPTNRAPTAAAATLDGSVAIGVGVVVCVILVAGILVLTVILVTIIFFNKNTKPSDPSLIASASFGHSTLVEEDDTVN